MTLDNAAEEQTRVRREKSKRAIALAMEGLWEEAIEVNRAILALSPEDVEALNRLGKALSELGRHNEARAAFQKALALGPTNAIARKNLERLAHVKGGGHEPRQREKVTPQLFIEDRGKTTLTSLINMAAREILARVSAGDCVHLKTVDGSLRVETAEGEYLGQIETRLSLRLIRLIKEGNRYTAAITTANDKEMALIIREVYQAPALAGVVSFPSKSDEYRGFITGEFDIGVKEEVEEADAIRQWEYVQENAGEPAVEAVEEEGAEGSVIKEPKEEDEEEDEEEEE